MQLTAGTRLDTYVIEAPLGAGGPPPFAVAIQAANFGEISPKPSPRGLDS